MMLETRSREPDAESKPNEAETTASRLGALARNLAHAGPAALDELGPQGLLAAWTQAVSKLRDPGSRIGRELRTRLSTTTGLSSAGLDAALEVMLAGVDRGPAEIMVASAEERPQSSGLVALVLASNVPALAVQSLLPALALGHPVLIKSATAEPHFASALAQALGKAAPVLRNALATVTWPGGDQAVENAVFRHCTLVLAYGNATTLADLANRLTEPTASARLYAFGPKLSLAALSRDTDPERVAPGLAKDIALFDQRGCLSIQAIYTAGDPVALAQAVAGCLRQRAHAWPVGVVDIATVSEVQKLRAIAAMKGLVLPTLGIKEGTVVVDPDPTLRPSPGLRTVRVHPLESLDDLPRLLEPWAGRLQGAALAGGAAWTLAPELENLGVSRCAAPGDLQAVDVSWPNGGMAPLDVLS